MNFSINYKLFTAENENVFAEIQILKTKWSIIRKLIYLCDVSSLTCNITVVFHQNFICSLEDTENKSSK